MKKTGFRIKTYEEKLEKLKAKQLVKKVPKKKKVKKVTITKVKDNLWEECKRIVRKTYISDDGFYRCFTCRTIVEFPHTGHIITSSTCSMEMRYSLDNLRLQCYACNIHKSGNWVEFKKRLGDEYINNLIKRNDETIGGSYGLHWTQNKYEEYRLLCRE